MTILVFLIVLSLLVLVHEFGHFIAARIFGVKAIEFGLGFPPRLTGLVKEKGKRWKHVGPRDDKEYKSTVWSLNWLPFGGFVRLKGEQEEAEHDKDSLLAVPLWRRGVIMAGGVLMNWLFAFVVFSVIFMVGTPTVLEDLPAGARIKDRSIVVSTVLDDSPAKAAGIEQGDQVLKVGDYVPKGEQDLRDHLSQNGQKPVSLEIKRDGQVKTLQATPQMIKEINRFGLGIGLVDIGQVSFTPPQAVLQAGRMTWQVTKLVVFAFGGLFRDLFVDHRVSPDLSGPVGIAVITGQVARQGIVPLLQFAAMLSINLAVINFLPIPALDGGRVAFLMLEKIRRKPLSHKLESTIHNAAFIVLILVIVLVTARDLFRYGGLIIGGLKGLVGI